MVTMKHFVLLPQDAASGIRRYLGQRPHDEVVLQVEALETAPGLADEAVFKMLDELVLSGQVPQDRVPALVNSVPGFHTWRQANKAEDNDQH